MSKVNFSLSTHKESGRIPAILKQPYFSQFKTNLIFVASIIFVAIKSI
jgi:hypothetical protein